MRDLIIKIGSLTTFLILIFIFSILSPEIYAQISKTYKLEPDYRNRINVPVFDKSLMPLSEVTTGNGTWTELNPKVPRVDYNAVDFYSAQEGIFVGDKGVIILTYDGGRTFHLANSGTIQKLTDVKFINRKNIISCGIDGTILFSSDGGKTWHSNVASNNDLNAIAVTENDIIFIVGDNGTILKSIDYGNHWINLQPPQHSFHNYAVYFWNALEGIVSTDGGKILKTNNGGEEWHTKQAGDNYRLYTIAVADSHHVVAGGEYLKFVYSADRGETWQQTSLGVGNSIKKIAFFNENTGIAVGPGNAYLMTTNKGFSWQIISKPFFAESSIAFLDTNSCIAIGEKLKIFKSTDMGISWNKLILNTNIKNIAYVDSLKGFFISQDFDGGLFNTNNGGISWHRNNNFPYLSVAGPLSAIEHYQNKIYVGGYNSNIILSSDYGNTWHKANIYNFSDTLNTYVNKFLFISGELGYAFTSKGYVLITEDGGENWNVVSSFNHVINNLYMLDSLHGYLCSNNLFYTEDGGYTWQTHNCINTASGYFDIKYLTYEKRLIITSDSIYITHDAGFSWRSIHKASGQIYSLDDSLIFVIGRESVVSYDGGINWTKILTSITEGETLTASVINISQIVLAGSTGLILKYTQPQLSSIGEVHNQDLKNYNQISLYPNPTNNQTNILINIIRDSEIIIGIYDIIGGEIHRLNLGYLYAGNHRFSLNFNDLKQPIAAGVYIIGFIDNYDSKRNYLSKKIIYLK